jgi:TonB-dependent receptor
VKLIATLFIALFTTLSVQSKPSQELSTISGKITDAKTNEALYGAKVMVLGMSKGCVVDAEGNYTISDLPAGKYTLEIRNQTYNTMVLSDIIVKAKETRILDIKMEKVVVEYGPVTVYAKVNKESTTELIRMQKNSASVVDGINAETFKKTPDSKAADILKRISGASVQDNKFLVIRGLSDRYNFALLNGAPLPSTESDKKAFSFDIFPSNMLDNLLIMKTATPELPGEFAGGVLDINTVEPKDKNYQSVQLSLGYNTLSTFKNFKDSEDSKIDFLSLGGADRSIPDGIPSTIAFSSLNKDDKARLAQNVLLNWSPKSTLALPNSSIQFALGRIYKLKDSIKSVGFSFAYSYSNTSTYSTIIRREFEGDTDPSGNNAVIDPNNIIKRMELVDSVFTQSVLNSAMFNVKYVLGPKSNIQFKNIYSLNSEDKISIRNGVRELDNDPHQYEKATNFLYNQNNLYTGQLIGKHSFEKFNINWNGGYSNVTRVIPSQRRVVYRKNALDVNDTTQEFIAVIQNNGTLPSAAGNMFWSTANENVYSLKYDIVLPFEVSILKNELKVGGFHQYRSREFTARNFGFSKYTPTGSSFNDQLLLLPENEIFAAENLGMMASGLGGFKLEEATNVDDSYQASALLNAGFVSLDSKIGEKFRIIGGARLEAYNQVFKYIEFGSNLEKRIDSTVIDLLPSINLIYSINKKMNVRASIYKTVSRPEFRELAPFSFYNFSLDNIISGDPKLKRAVITNLDLRYEYFPGEGQIISVSGFYKDFTDPIELINRTGTSGAPELYYTNVPKVTNYGVEAEWRMKLGFLSKQENHPLWSNITLYANASIIRSKVDLSNTIGSGIARPLQGQSPYIANAGLYYAKNDFSISCSYNIVGQRIYIVGNIQEPNVWENGRHIIDLQVAKTFNEKFELKLNVKDLLAQKLIYFQDLNNDRKYTAEADNTWQESSFGQTVSLSLKYNF